MKKSIKLFLLMIIVVFLTSCGKKHPIDKFKEKMENVDSFQMTVAMSDIPLLGSLTLTTKVDGNIEYIGSFLYSEEQYLEKVDDEIYLYTKDENGNWIKSKSDLNEEELSNVFSEKDLYGLLNSKNYEAVEGEENTYRQKKNVVFENYDEVKIYIGEEVYILEMNITTDGVTIKTKITISKIGEIELRLPTVE